MHTSLLLGQPHLPGITFSLFTSALVPTPRPSSPRHPVAFLKHDLSMSLPNSKVSMPPQDVSSDAGKLTSLAGHSRPPYLVANDLSSTLLRRKASRLQLPFSRQCLPTRSYTPNSSLWLQLGRGLAQGRHSGSACGLDTDPPQWPSALHQEPRG